MKRLCPLLALTTLLLTSTLASATAISGSLPFVLVDVLGNGTDLSNTTILLSSDSLTEGAGIGDFAAVPTLTSFGSTSLHESSIAVGGGFAVANSTWGSFVADGGSVVTRTPTFLNIDLTGTYTPGPGFPGLTASPTIAHLTYDETGAALSGAFTLETTSTVPESSTLSLAACGLVLSGAVIQRRKSLC